VTSSSDWSWWIWNLYKTCSLARRLNAISSKRVIEASGFFMHLWARIIGETLSQPSCVAMGVLPSPWRKLGLNLCTITSNCLAHPKKLFFWIEVIQYRSCLDVSSHDLLLALVTSEDIRKAIFSIRNDKAPGLIVTPSFSNKLGCGWGVFLCCCPRFLPIREALEADQPLCYSIGSQISKCLLYQWF